MADITIRVGARGEIPLVLCLVALVVGAGAARAADDGPLSGFSPRAAADERRVEKTLLATPQPDSARRHLVALTEEPHVAGTPADHATALYVRDRMAALGLDARVVEYQVLLNYPRHNTLALVEPEFEELSLREPALDGDKDSADSSFFDGFHGYSADGVVTAQVVYVNYGRPEDYEALDKLGVSVRGRIALARYGRLFRGLKVRLAEEHGAVGTIIYSDPADDGYAKGDVYPDGPWRSPGALERGSVQFLSTAPGDPGTPGWAAVRGARRIARADMRNVPHIPSLPLSYGEAQKILARLGGPNVPDGFQGALPFAYHAGPGAAKVRMQVENDYAVRTIWDVITTIPGSERPERWVVCGNHRDAWTYGANDPNSGTAILLETARSLAAALRDGWRPRRTIVLCSWDGEEYGLLGSTEWGEDGAATLPGKAVAYLNLDSSTSGKTIGVSGVPSLRDFFFEAAGDVADPVTGRPLAEAWDREARKAGRAAWRQERWYREAHHQSAPAQETELGALGSGSDYTVFFDHLGIPAADFRFSGPNGVYHSAYDDLAWMDRFGDRLYVYSSTGARLWSLLCSRLADAEVLPLHYSRYGRAVEDALIRLERRVEEEGEDAPRDTLRLRLALDRAQLLASGIAAAGGRLEQAIRSALASGAAEVNGRPLAVVNDELIAVERDLLAPDGLKGRPWFRHLIYAPGRDTGYDAVLLPELAQAVTDHSQADLDAGEKRLEDALARAAQRLEALAGSAR